MIYSNFPIYKHEVTIQKVRTLKNVGYFETKKLVFPVNQDKSTRAGNLQNVCLQSTVKEILPMVSQFTEKYFSEVL